MNPSPPPTPARTRPAVPLLLASAQLAAAVTGLACAVANGIGDELALAYFGQWDRVPAPLVITASAIATVILLWRGRYRGALTAAIVPLAAHLLAMVSQLPLTKWLPFGSWVRHALTLPLGQPPVLPYPTPAKIADRASMAAIVLGVAVAVSLARAVRRQERSPVPPGAPVAVVAATSLLAIATYWAGEDLSQLPDQAGSTRPAVVALVVATVTALIDAHTRWAAREGLTTVAALSAGVSGAVLIVPLGWLHWPLIQQWLWPPPAGKPYSFSEGYIVPRWEGLAECLTTLGWLLGLVAVSVAALTAAHRMPRRVGASG